jgi:hypothetical protein
MPAPKLTLWPREYLFLFSHMRSFSTVLSHVLGSHPQICGYSETHLKYRHRSDLHRLRWRVGRATGSWPRGRYLLDKLLHNFMLIPKDLRYSPQLRTLIFLREPEPTLQSILRLNANGLHRSWYDNATRAAEYYCERVTWLTAVGVHFKHRAFAFPAETIIDQTAPLLTHLGTFLDLDTALQPSYRLQRLSGLPSHGDSSARLQAGTVLHRPQPSTPDPIHIDRKLIDQCTRVYRTCMSTLADWCPSYGLLENETATKRTSRVA